jgi:hypothetical protein
MNTKTTTGLITIAAALALAVGLTMSVQQVFAPGSCSSCARAFAPGQIAINNEISANTVAPGEHVEAGGCGSCQGASDFAPGIEKQIPTGPGP